MRLGRVHWKKFERFLLMWAANLSLKKETTASIASYFTLDYLAVIPIVHPDTTRPICNRPGANFQSAQSSLREQILAERDSKDGPREACYGEQSSDRSAKLLAPATADLKSD